ncbi:hypothetical protein NDU88_006372 [Pleurodeles waltl]|uniref:Uncharacterized protein n=1 Tax=Pleurodeles waltl TaxID=8319 RepID=A0AAV7MC09_PLEWA|nr:hypothetical protein NDU88_006372 [Pleurodeles waltl]
MAVTGSSSVWLDARSRCRINLYLDTTYEGYRACTHYNFGDEDHRNTLTRPSSAWSTDRSGSWTDLVVIWAQSCVNRSDCSRPHLTSAGTLFPRRGPRAHSPRGEEEASTDLDYRHRCTHSP